MSGPRSRQDTASLPVSSEARWGLWVTGLLGRGLQHRMHRAQVRGVTGWGRTTECAGDSPHRPHGRAAGFRGNPARTCPGRNSRSKGRFSCLLSEFLSLGAGPDSPGSGDILAGALGWWMLGLERTQGVSTGPGARGRWAAGVSNGIREPRKGLPSPSMV